MKDIRSIEKIDRIERNRMEKNRRIKKKRIEIKNKRMEMECRKERENRRIEIKRIEIEGKIRWRIKEKKSGGSHEKNERGVLGGDILESKGIE